MTLARKYLISTEDTSYYHVMTRCVRRAFLCGIDKYSGNNYEHRREMIVKRVKDLVKIFNMEKSRDRHLKNKLLILKEIKFMFSEKKSQSCHASYLATSRATLRVTLT